MNIPEEELINIKGGAAVSAAFITALFRSYSFIHDLGTKVGSALRYYKTKRTC